MHSRSHEKEPFVDRLMRPIRVEEEYRLKGKSKKEREREINSERKLPLILQGRLRSMSPEIIMKILQK